MALQKQFQQGNFLVEISQLESHHTLYRPTRQPYLHVSLAVNYGIHTVWCDFNWDNYLQTFEKYQEFYRKFPQVHSI